MNRANREAEKLFLETHDQFIALCHKYEKYVDFCQRAGLIHKDGDIIEIRGERVVLRQRPLFYNFVGREPNCYLETLNGEQFGRWRDFKMPYVGHYESIEAFSKE